MALISSIIFILLLTCFVNSIARPVSSDSDSVDIDIDIDIDCTNTFVPRIGVANKGRGDGLLIEAESESLLSIILDDNSEPMYLLSSVFTNEIYIGDRSNSQIYVYDTTTLQRIDIIPGCKGIFHQFYNFKNQLWVVCNIDLTILVIDTNLRKQIITIPIAGIDDTGFVPHDVTTYTKYAFVSLLKPNDPDGIVIKYSTDTFQELDRITVGGDPHLWVNPFDPNPAYLYVVSQVAGELYKIEIDTLHIIGTLNVNGAHGIWGTQTDDYLYVTNIQSQDGTNALYVIEPNKFDHVRMFDAVVGAPHNVMVTSTSIDQPKLFVAHSAGGVVSVYDIRSDGSLDAHNGRIIFEDEMSVPFGVMIIIGRDEFNCLTGGSVQ